MGMNRLSGWTSALMVVGLSGISGCAKAPEHAAPPGVSCNDLAGVAELVAGHEGVYIAEKHGQKQSAIVVGCLIEAALSQGRDVHVSLEMPDKPELTPEDWQYGEVGLGGGAPDTRAMFEYYRQVPGVTFSFHVPTSALLTDSGTFSFERQERAMAERILAGKRSGAFLIALSGNYHARRNQRLNGDGATAHAGDYMPESVPVVALLAHEGGTAFNCTTSCALWDQPVPGERWQLKPELGVQKAAVDEYDYYINAGRFTAIDAPPADHPVLLKYGNLLPAEGVLDASPTRP